MGIARVIAENERLRQELATQKALLAERDAQIAALKVSNEDLAQRLELLRIKASERRNQRYIEDPAVIPLPLTFTPTPPPPRLPESEPTSEATPRTDVEKPKAKEKQHPQRRDLSQPSQRPVRKLACKIDPKAACKLTYAVNGREAFEHFLAHPELPMHNNRAEQALRGPVCGTFLRVRTASGRMLSGEWIALFRVWGSSAKIFEHF